MEVNNPKISENDYFLTDKRDTITQITNNEAEYTKNNNQFSLKFEGNPNAKNKNLFSNLSSTKTNNEYKEEYKTVEKNNRIFNHINKNYDYKNFNESNVIDKIKIETETDNPKGESILENKKYQNKNNDSNYSTFNNTNNKERSYEASIEINENTTTFDLYKGLIYMLFSCIFKSLFSVLSKYSLKDKKELSSFQLLTYRTYFMMWISIVVSFALPINVFSQKFAKLDKIVPVFFRTIFAIISMSLVIYSIKFIHISDVYSVYYIYPAFVILFSIIFLREKIRSFDICCLLACFIGAILIVKPDFIFKDSMTLNYNNQSYQSSYYFMLVIIAAILKAIEDVIIRNVGKDVNFLIFPFMYSLLGMILFPIPMFLFDSVYPNLSVFDVIIIFLIGLCTFLYMSFMALGFQNESAGRVSMVNYFQVALMYISDLCLFDKKLVFLDLVGTCLIFGFNFFNGLLKAFKRMNDLEKIKLKGNIIRNQNMEVVEK